MADDLLGMLYGSLTPERKLLTAITNNMTDSVRALLEGCDSRVLVNTLLQTQNGRAALHVACQTNRPAIVARLLAAGADVSAKDLFGLTPVIIALRNKSAPCVKLLLEHDARPCAVSLWGRVPPLAWTGSDHLLASWEQWMGERDLMEVVVVAMPRVPESLVRRALLELSAKNYEALLRFLLVVDHQWGAPRDQWSSGILTMVVEIKERRCVVQSLQYYTRLAIRTSVSTNVYHAAKQLPLPTSLQNYLTTFDTAPN